MGVTAGYTHDISSTVPLTRMFKALVVDSNKLIPKLMPQVQNVEVEGDGIIQTLNFVQGSPIKYLKHKIHVIDETNLESKYLMFEVDVVGDKLLESIYYHLKFEAGKNGGCVCKFITEYHTKGDYVLEEEEHNECKNQSMEFFKNIEAYLLANPSVYA